MKKNDNLEIGYRVADLRTIKFIFGEVEEKSIDSLLNDKDGANLTLGVHTEFNIEKNLVFFDVIIELMYNDEILINHVGRTGFEINGLSQLMISEEEIDFPQHILEQLYGISFSHSRALLAVETARTPYNGKFYIPVINPKRFIEERK